MRLREILLSFSYHPQRPWCRIVLTARSCRLFQLILARRFKPSSEKCPECKETDQEAFEAHDRARQKRERAIKSWKDQSEFMKQKIIEAGDNEEFKKQTGRLLKRCNTLWADKIKEAELESANQQSARPLLIEAAKNRLAEIEAKIKLMLEVAEYLRDQEDDRIIENEDKADYSNELALLSTNCKEWKDLVRSIEKLKERYNEEVMDKIKSVEEELEGIWKEAVRLMKS
jgi:hypothetical protein